MRRLALVAVIGFAGPAHAGPAPKPSVVVRVENGDGDSAKLALALTAGLRAASGARYVAKLTERQIQDVADHTECRLVEATCAAAFGAELGVEYVLAGEAETHGKRQLLVLSLVNVKTRQRVRSLRELVTNADTGKWARGAFERLVGSVGELTVVANAQRGEVLLDGQLVAALFDGRTTISGIALGGHQLGIRAKGYRPLDIDITVDGSTKEMLLLEALP